MLARTILLTTIVLCLLLGACAGFNGSPQTLPTVLIDRPVYFTNRDGSDTVARPGLYEVMPSGESGLRLTSPSHGEFLIRATSFTYDEELAAPVALAVPDNESDYHVVLLTPGGTGLDAAGSLTQVRSRGIGSGSLSKSKIKEALARLHARQQMAETLKAYPRLPLGQNEWQYQIDGQWMTESRALDYLARRGK
ncbi:MAG TPA: hypothetical protein VGJ57_07750 [Nitrospirales bacterium]